MGATVDEKSGDSLNSVGDNGSKDHNKQATDVELNRNIDDEPQVPAGTTERKIMTKIDMRVIPVLCIMYLLAFLGMSIFESSLCLWTLG
jgi:hypothetical protein